MKLQYITRESRTNTRTRASKPLLGALLLFPLILGLLVFELQSLTTIETGSLEYLETGAATLIIDSPEGINGIACDAIAQLPGFIASGAIKRSDATITLSKLPAAALTVHHTSAGFSRVINATPHHEPALITSVEVAEALGETAPAFTIDTAEQPLRITGTYPSPNSSIAGNLGWAALAQVNNTNTFDQCWATAWPPTDAHRAIMHQAETITPQTVEGNETPQPAQIMQLNTTLGSEYLYGETLTNRPSRLFGVAAFIASCSIAILLVRLRALELAALLHDGWKHTHVTLLVLCDNASWAGISLVGALSTSLILALTLNQTGDFAYNALALSTITISAFSGTVYGTWLGMLSIKEQRLFELFKNR